MVQSKVCSDLVVSKKIDKEIKYPVILRWKKEGRLVVLFFSKKKGVILVPDSYPATNKIGKYPSYLVDAEDSCWDLLPSWESIELRN